MNNPAYDEIFSSMESLKVVTLVTTGRTGSDFFQSLLDGHSQIVQFPGHCNFHVFWEEAVCKDNVELLFDEFIWYKKAGYSHIYKFVSKYDTEERLDQLGTDKNESFEVDIETFRAHAVALMQGRTLNSKNFFLALHGAYALTTGKNISSLKMLFYHLHAIEKLPEIERDFPHVFTICTIREPRNTLVSGLENWKKYRSDTFVPWFFFTLLTEF